MNTEDLVNLYNLIALPKEAETHINLGCTLSTPTPAGFGLLLLWCKF